jgi:hypothetical protein
MASTCWPRRAHRYSLSKLERSWALAPAPEHTLGFRYVTFYSEIRNPQVNVYRKDADDKFVLDANGAPIVESVITGSDLIGREVRQGERIAEVKDFHTHDDHLHFELRYPFANNGNKKSETLAVDPTWALYAWEKKMYRENDAGARHIGPTRISELSEIVRGRLIRFLRVRLQGIDRNVYFPLGGMEDEDRSMVETLRSAFFAGKSVELTWRESLFFNQIEFRFDSDNKIAIAVEARVVG